jgi:hypothetical protein
MNTPNDSGTSTGDLAANQIGAALDNVTLVTSSANAAAAKPDNCVALDEPIVRGTSKILEIVLRKPTAGELRGVRLDDVLNGDVSALLAVLPRISMPTLVKHEVEALDPADLAALGEVVISFFLPRATREKLGSR